MMYSVRCKQCAKTVVHNPKRLMFCDCEHDSTSWVAITSSGKLVTAFGANTEIVEKE